MKKEFYIFRHGETDYNKEGILQGCGIDSTLNKKGLLQAEELASGLVGKDLEVIFSSPLKRAVKTAKAVTNRLGIDLFLVDDLKEGCFGVAEGVKIEQLEKIYLEFYKNWRNLDLEFMDIRYEGGESKQEIQDRIFGVLEDLLKKPYSIMGILTHGAAIRFLMLKYGVKLPKIPNGATFHLVYEDGVWFVSGF